MMDDVELGPVGSGVDKISGGRQPSQEITQDLTEVRKGSLVPILGT